MSAKRVLVLAATTIAATATGSTLLSGSVAQGATARAQVVRGTTLHLPAPVRVITRPSSSFVAKHKQQITALLTYRSGAKAGNGVYTCSSRGNILTCDSAWSLPGGVILSHETIDISVNKLTGRVTSGNGIYAGAKGKITGNGRADGSASLNIDWTSG